MKKILFNRLNYLILFVILLVMLAINYNVNIKQNNQFNEYLQEMCLDKNNIIEENIVEMCERIEAGGKALYLKFNNVYDYLGDQTRLLFFSFLVIFLITSTYKFHRVVHSGYVKNVLTRQKYKEFIKNEILNSIGTMLFLFTGYFIIVFAISYFTSEVLNDINYYKIFIEYFNTFLYMLLSILIAIILLKRINNIVLYILVSFLSILSLSIAIDAMSTILNIITNNDTIIEFMNSFILPHDDRMKFYFIPQTLLNLLMLFIMLRIYINKEELIIESER